jgi:hypothetical protein
MQLFYTQELYRAHTQLYNKVRATAHNINKHHKASYARTNTGLSVHIHQKDQG